MNNPEKGKAVTWFVATIHFLKSMFVMPLVFLVTLYLPLMFLNQALGGNDVVYAVEVSAVMIVAIWFGALWSAKGMMNKYVITENDKIIKTALLIGVAVFGIDRFFTLIAPEGLKGVNLVYTVATIMMLVTFYYSSNKYLKNNSL